MEKKCAELLPWLMEGLKALVRKDPYAWLRIIGGLVAIAVGVLIPVLIFAGGARPGRGIAKLSAGIILAGALLVFSALTLSEEVSP